jgi:hypothetical protein
MAAETKSELPAAGSTPEQTAVIEKHAGDQPAPFLGGTLDSTFFVGVAMACSSRSCCGKRCRA